MSNPGPWAHGRPDLSGGTVKQTPITRNLLARLDLAIIDLEEEQRNALDVARLARDNATAVGEIKARLMSIRDGLRGVLDSSAPRAFPYDSRDHELEGVPPVTDAMRPGEPEPMDSRERKLHYLLARVLAYPRWLSIGSHENTAEFRISRNLYEDAMATLRREDANSQKAPSS